MLGEVLPFPLVATCSTAAHSCVQEETALKEDNSSLPTPKPNKCFISDADHPCDEVWNLTGRHLSRLQFYVLCLTCRVALLHCHALSTKKSSLNFPLVANIEALSKTVFLIIIVCFLWLLFSFDFFCLGFSILFDFSAEVNAVISWLHF